MQAAYTIGIGQAIQPGLAFYARCCQVDNPGGQWVHFPDVEAWVAPYMRGAVVAFSVATSTPRVDTRPPLGALVPVADPTFKTFTQIGSTATLRFSSAAGAPVAGTPVPVPTAFTQSMTWNQSGVPATDPYSVTGSVSLGVLFGLVNVSVDLVAITAAFQGPNLPQGVGSVAIQVTNAPLLALPQSGILQQAFPPGSARTFIQRFPLLIPSCTVQSAGGGSVLLTTVNQTIQVQATYQLALV